MWRPAGALGLSSCSWVWAGCCRDHSSSRVTAGRQQLQLRSFHLICPLSPCLGLICASSQGCARYPSLLSGGQCAALYIAGRWEPGHYRRGRASGRPLGGSLGCGRLWAYISSRLVAASGVYLHSRSRETLEALSCGAGMAGSAAGHPVSRAAAGGSECCKQTAVQVVRWHADGSAGRHSALLQAVSRSPRGVQSSRAGGTIQQRQSWPLLGEGQYTAQRAAGAVERVGGCQHTCMRA